ncbi:hypothetical protein [Streptomyces sp. TRM64462]|uniref:hypothetical protein n=1 Tax=Streptomyces sp. TRM64462 TaxID=2741726 RepID=UPI0015864535|nr:hypothetical protein [Streptomyces sp. TRM64462]
MKLVSQAALQPAHCPVASVRAGATLDGAGYSTTVHGLTADDIPSSSAHDQQRKHEALLDADDVALGYKTRMRWNGADQWTWSKDIVHPPLIDLSDFQRVQERLAARRGNQHGPKKRRALHTYELQGLVTCGLCQRRMGTHWVHETAYGRCR